MYVNSQVLKANSEKFSIIINQLPISIFEDFVFSHLNFSFLVKILHIFDSNFLVCLYLQKKDSVKLFLQIQMKFTMDELTNFFTIIRQTSPNGVQMVQAVIPKKETKESLLQGMIKIFNFILLQNYKNYDKPNFLFL